MKDDVGNKQLLADYLYGDLEPGDEMEFERMISDHPELSESYHFHVKVRDYLKAKIQLEEMRSDPLLGEAEKLAEHAFDDDAEASVPGMLRKRLKYIPAVAASIALLLVVRFFIPATNPDALFSAYYTPLSATNFNQRGETDVISSEFSESIDLFNQGAYEQSIRILNQLETAQTELPEVELFQGLNYMGLEQYGKAKDFLNHYIENNTRLLPEAYWYLSLCFLKTGEYAKSRALLSRLGAYDGMYKKDAQVLERKLRRIR